MIEEKASKMRKEVAGNPRRYLSVLLVVALSATLLAVMYWKVSPRQSRAEDLRTKGEYKLRHAVDQAEIEAHARGLQHHALSSSLFDECATHAYFGSDRLWGLGMSAVFGLPSSRSSGWEDGFRWTESDSYESKVPNVLYPFEGNASPLFPKAINGSRILIVASEIAPEDEVAWSNAELPFYEELAFALAANGADVSFMYIFLDMIPLEPRKQLLQQFQAHGVRLLGPPKNKWPLNSPIASASFSILQHLLQQEYQDTPYDIVHFTRRFGLGYMSQLARQQGWALQSTTMVVGITGNHFWNSIQENQLPSTPQQLVVQHYEAESLRIADVTWAPSVYLAASVQARGQYPSSQILVLPYYVNTSRLGSGLSEQPCNPPSSDTKPIEVVFVGTVTRTSGILLFARAMKELRILSNTSFHIHFVHDGAFDDAALRLIGLARDMLGRWPASTVKFSEMSGGEMLHYVSQPNKITVLPFLVFQAEHLVSVLLGKGIPFLASDIGGVRELIEGQSRRHTLFRLQPTDLARKLKAVLEHKAWPCPRGTGSQWARLQVHLKVHEELLFHDAAPATTLTLQPATPKVSVIITHFERGELSMQTLFAVALQTYKNLEVVFVDDGSTSQTVLKVLKDEVQPYVEKRGWKFLRIPNSYVGAARNRGAAIASGKYLLFLDDDDVPKLSYVQTLVESAERTGCHVLSTFFARFASSVSPLGKEDYDIWTFHGPAIAAGAFENYLGGANIFTSAAAFQALGGFSELRSVGYEDYQYISRAVLAGFKHAVVPDALLYVRSTPGSMQRTTDLFISQLRGLPEYLSAVGSTFSSLDGADALLVAKSLFLDTIIVAPTIDLWQIRYKTHRGCQQGQMGFGFHFLALPRRFVRTGLSPPVCFVLACIQKNKDTIDPPGEAHSWTEQALSCNSGVGSFSWRSEDEGTNEELINDGGLRVVAGSNETVLVPIVTWESFLQGRYLLGIAYSVNGRDCGSTVCMSVFAGNEPLLHECGAPDDYLGGSRVKQLTTTLQVGLTLRFVLQADPAGLECGFLPFDFMLRRLEAPQ